MKKNEKELANEKEWDVRRSVSCFVRSMASSCCLLLRTRLVER